MATLALDSLNDDVLDCIFDHVSFLEADDEPFSKRGREAFKALTALSRTSRLLNSKARPHILREVKLSHEDFETIPELITEYAAFRSYVRNLTISFPPLSEDEQEYTKILHYLMKLDYLQELGHHGGGWAFSIFREVCEATPNAFPRLQTLRIDPWGTPMTTYCPQLKVLDLYIGHAVAGKAHRPEAIAYLEKALTKVVERPTLKVKFTMDPGNALTRKPDPPTPGLRGYLHITEGFPSLPLQTLRDSLTPFTALKILHLLLLPKGKERFDRSATDNMAFLDIVRQKANCKPCIELVCRVLFEQLLLLEDIEFSTCKMSYQAGPVCYHLRAHRRDGKVESLEWLKMTKQLRGWIDECGDVDTEVWKKSPDGQKYLQLVGL